MEKSTKWGIFFVAIILIIIINFSWNPTSYMVKNLLNTPESPKTTQKESISGSSIDQLNTIEPQERIQVENINDFKELNQVYSSIFTKPYPARQVIGASKLPLNSKIEISCIAYKN